MDLKSAHRLLDRSKTLNTGADRRRLRFSFLTVHAGQPAGALHELLSLIEAGLRLRNLSPTAS